MRVGLLVVLASVLSACFRGPSGSDPPPESERVRSGDDRMPPGVTGGTGVAVVPPTVMPVPVPPPPPPRMGPPPPDAPGDPMSCELSHMQLDPICTSCTCSETGCWGPVAQCGSDCLALVACVLRFCDGLVAQERTSCALAECAEYISAASTASLAGPCFERCRDECLPGLDAVIGYEPELDAGR